MRRTHPTWLHLSLMSLTLVVGLSGPSLSEAKKLKDILKEAVLQPENTASKDTATNTETAANNTTQTVNENSAGTGINWKKPSKEEEAAVGRKIAGNLLGAAPLVKDEALQTYVNRVGRWVANQSDRPELNWHFGVIESNDLNAFAAPGGYILITKGLYQKLQNEAQLAGVLAHEIGHVVKKHHLKVMQKSQLLNLGASLLSNKLGENATIDKVIGNGAEIMSRGLDKEAEFEADRVGISLATRAGYEPLGLVDVLQLIAQTNPSDSSVALLYKTHPSPEERLVKLDEAIGNKLDTVPEGKALTERFYALKP